MDQSGRSPTSVRDAGAPEVAYSQAPIFAGREAEGLQNADHFNPAASPDDVLLHKEGSGQLERAIDHYQPRQRRWLCYLLWLIVLLAIFAVGMGAGIGIEHRRVSYIKSQAPGPEAPTTVTVTGFQGTSTATTSAVTSGSTGIAAYSCNDTSNSIYITTSGTKYVEDCHSDYWGATWNASYTDSGATVQDLDSKTVYSFEDCIGQCDAYNAALAPGAPPCRAVTYGANITEEVAKNGGSCWLKNTKGVGFNPSGGEDYALVASAYQACVVDGC